MLKKLIKKILRPVYRSNPTYKEWERLRLKEDEFAPLRIPKKEIQRLLNSHSSDDASVLFDKVMRMDSPYWYVHSLREIFLDKIYQFDTVSEVPFIIDCGANIGLSVINFKMQYPKAEVVAFEPDPNVFNILKTNLKTFGLNDIKCEQKAVWKQEGFLNFAALGAVSGKIDISGTADTNSIIQIPSIRLRDLLNKKVHFLKIDIEGAEYDVIKDCKDLLQNVDNLFVEYHSERGHEQMLPELLEIFKEAGFTIYIKDACNNFPYPFSRKNYNPFFDLQLNIFGYRI